MQMSKKAFSSILSSAWLRAGWPKDRARHRALGSSADIPRRYPPARLVARLAVSKTRHALGTGLVREISFRRSAPILLLLVVRLVQTGGRS